MYDFLPHRVDRSRYAIQAKIKRLQCCYQKHIIRLRKCTEAIFSGFGQVIGHHNVFHRPMDKRSPNMEKILTNKIRIKIYHTKRVCAVSEPAPVPVPLMVAFQSICRSFFLPFFCSFTSGYLHSRLDPMKSGL